MTPSNRPAHRPVRFPVAQMLLDRNNNTTRHLQQPRPVAVLITPVFSSRYSWQPGFLPSKAVSQRQQSILTGHVPSKLVYSWPFNPQDTDLIRAGYKPEYKPSKAEKAKSKMAEPRARVARHKGQMNFPSERKYYVTTTMLEPIRYNRMMAMTYIQYSSPPTPRLRRSKSPSIFPHRTPPRNSPRP